MKELLMLNLASRWEELFSLHNEIFNRIPRKYWSYFKECAQICKVFLLCIFLTDLRR